MIRQSLFMGPNGRPEIRKIPMIDATVTLDKAPVTPFREPPGLWSRAALCRPPGGVERGGASGGGAPPKPIEKVANSP